MTVWKSKFFDSLEKENFTVWERKFWQFGKGKFYSLRKKIWTVWKENFDSLSFSPKLFSILGHLAKNTSPSTPIKFRTNKSQIIKFNPRLFLEIFSTFLLKIASLKMFCCCYWRCKWLKTERKERRVENFIRENDHRI